MIAPWASWIRGQASEGTVTQTSAISASLPPPRPLRASAVIPRDRAASTAASTFGEFPLVDIASRTSPFPPWARTWREKTSSKP